jgi:addiction module RelB/DinJ family antitoxin
MEFIMKKETYVRARVTIELKDEAEKILNAEGFTMSTVISMMLRQVVNHGKLPFPLDGALRLNAKSQAVCDAVDAGTIMLTEHKDSASFFKSLGIGD